MLRSIILFALALYLPLLNSGQELCYEHYPLAPVINILDTGEEVWMTTRGDGVFRFDKTNNTTEQFTNGEAGLNSDYCHDLIYYNGHLLISTDSVVYAFDNGQFVTHLDSIGGAMAISSEGRLIVASGERYTEWDDGTIYYEKDLFELGPEGLQLSCGICDMSSDITIDDEGRVWISHFGFYEFDILRYDGLEWLVFDHQSVGSDVLPIESFDHRNQIFAHDGSIWASSWIGLNKEFNGEWELYHNPGSMNWGIVNSTDTLATYPLALTRDTEGALWIGSISSEWTAEASQLASFIDDEWQVFDGLPDFNGFNCLSPSATDTDILYAGTTAGLTIVDKECLSNSISSLEEPVFELFVDQNNGLLYIDNYDHFSPSEYLLIDMKGEIVNSGPIVSSSLEINIASMNSGQYLIQLTSSHSLSSRTFLKLGE